MSMKTKPNRKRFLAGLLCAAMALSLIAGLGPLSVKTAEAAETEQSIFADEKAVIENRPSGNTFEDSDGNTQNEVQILIQILDSSLPGADAASRTANAVKLNDAFKGYKPWADNMTTDDLISMGEGLGRFEDQPIICYDLGTDAVSSHAAHSDDKCTIPDGNVVDGKYYKVQDCLEAGHFGKGYQVKYHIYHTPTASYLAIYKSENAEWFKANHKYAFVIENKVTRTGYGYLPNSEANSESAGGKRGWQLRINTNGQDRLITLDTWRNKGDEARQPLHNEVMRGGFQFSVRDVETNTYVSNGAGNIGDSVFAVFNINGTALAPDAYEKRGNDGSMVPTDSTKTEKGARGLADFSSTGYGYVTVDSDGNGKIEDKEATTCYPAYTYDEVIQAWKEYLQKSATIKNGVTAGTMEGTYVNGAYGHGDYKTLGIDGNAGSFVMGYTGDTEKKTGMPIIPCMILKPDDNGNIKTGAYALPTGNYLVLQVRAGDGMYIDENFRPMVSVGPWYIGTGAAQDGYGNMAFGQVGYDMDSTIALKGSHNLTIGSRPYGYPVAYVGANTGTVFNFSSLTENSTNFFIDVNGNRSQIKNLTSGSTEPGPTYKMANSLATLSDYLVNMDKGSVTTDQTLASGVGATRRQPRVGYSRFTAYPAPVRGGVRFYIGDADDVRATAAANSTLGTYIAEPQGNGDLSGAIFRIYNNVPVNMFSGDLPTSAEGQGVMHTPAAHIAQAGIDQVTVSDGVKGSQKKSLEYGSNDYQEYMVYQEAGTGQYFLQIPVDELPYGAFAIKQITTGRGYGSWTGHEDENWHAESVEQLTPIVLWSEFENTLVPTYDGVNINRGMQPATQEILKTTQETMDAHTIGGHIYIPQTLVDGGYLIDVDGEEDVDQPVKVTVRVFNISDHYVYTDVDGNGTEEKVPTSQKTFNQKMKGKAMTVNQVAETTKSWDSCVREFTDMRLGDMRNAVEGLPYGTYLLAVTAITDGYAPITSTFVTDSIDYDGDQVQFSIRVLDEDRIPVMSTTLLDNDYLLDSVAWMTERTLVDELDLGNLQPDTEYTAYGILIDKATNAMVPGSQIATIEHIKGFVATDDSATGGVITGSSASGLQANLMNLLSTGETYSSSGAVEADPTGYGVWVYNLRDYAASCGDPLLPTLVTTLSNQYTSNYNSTFVDRYHVPVVARLRYLAGLASGNDPTANLNGHYAGKLYYNYVPIRNDADKTMDQEGHTYVAMAILCEGGTVVPDALLANDLGGLMAITNPTSVLIRNDLGDEEETAYVAALDIEAVSSVTGNKELDPSETVKATVTYGNVEVGNDYQLTVRLKDGHGDWVLGEDGTVMTVKSSVFRATDVSGRFDAVFDGLDVAAYNGQRLSAYATLERVVTNGQVQNSYWLIEKGDALTMGYNSSDPEPGRNQVDVVAPTVRTVLSDKYGNKEVDFDNKVTLQDTVDYTMLIAGEQYEAVMTLVDKTGVVLKDDAGNDLIVKEVFTVPATNKDGKFRVTLEATFDGTDLLGQEIVSYNDLYHITPDRKAHVAEEHELTSTEQTILATGESVRTLFTTVARDDTTRTHYAVAGADTAITDVVTIRNLEPGEKYMLKTELAYANTGKVLNQFEPVYTAVTADNDGDVSQEVKMNINTNAFKGQTLVVYQTLYDAKEKEVIAQHTSNTDANQMLYIADIDTVATGENGRSKSIHPDLIENEDVSTSTVDGELKVNVTKDYTYEATIADRVYYSNLVPGTEYKITTEVVAKKGGAVIATTSQNYTPSTASGSFTAYISVDVTGVLGDEVVLYETVTDLYSNQVVAVHKDLDDADQTVKILGTAGGEDDPANDPDDPANDPNDPENGENGPGENSGKNIQTGVAEHYRLFFILAALIGACGIGGGAWLFWKKRRDS